MELCFCIIPCKMSLTERLSIAIANNDASTIDQIISICDRLHYDETVTVDGETFTSTDMPSDALYEMAKRKLQEIADVAIMSVSVPNVNEISDMYMGKDTIIKSPTVDITNQKVICMPKYDGVSCMVRFRREGERLIIDQAETRGQDVGVTHKSTDMKDRMKQLLDKMPWIDRLNALKCDSITIRGEIVLARKIEAVPAPYVAGKINSKSPILDPDDVMCFKMFEISRFSVDGKSSTPSQENACRILQTIDSSLVYTMMELNADTVKNTEQMLELYHRWEDLSSPIDGVVYCDPSWHYPTSADVASGVNYGKYAMKPCEFAVSIFKDIEYTIAKDGKLNPIIHFDDVHLFQKTYRKSKSVISNMVTFLDQGIGPGSTIQIKFPAKMIPMVVAVVSRSETPVALPTICPYCGEALTYQPPSVKPKRIATLTCRNDACVGVICKELEAFFKNIGVSKVGKKTIAKAFAEGPHSVTIDELSQVLRSLNIQSYVMASTISSLVIGLSICTKTTLKKLTQVQAHADGIVRDNMPLVRETLTQHQTVIGDALLTLLP